MTHSDGCAGGCGTNDSDNPPCPAREALTDASLEVLAAQRRVIEQLRELAFPDQIGQPIEQDAMRRLLTLVEEQAIERAGVTLTQPQPDAGLREAAQAVVDDWFGTYDPEVRIPSAAENIEALRAALRSTPTAPRDTVTVERLAEAIEQACFDHNEACWFRTSPAVGAAAILLALQAAG